MVTTRGGSENRALLPPQGSRGIHSGGPLGGNHACPYPRLRIGIGRPEGGTIAHVLGGFAPGEEDALAEALSRAADAVEAWAEHGVDAAMNQFN